MLFAGGILQNGYQCGMIWGATLAAGAQAYRLHGPEPQAESAAIRAGERLVESFREHNKHINCLEITDIDKSSSSWQMIKFFLFKGGPINCIRRASKYAPVAFKEVEAALAEEPAEVPASPVSCAAALAKKMGASDLHTVMASGFAGGIGLCGGACGALGAAVWLIGMDSAREQDGKIGFRDARALAAIDRFLKYTDYKFQCSEIVGRKFEGIGDHAAYVRDGGCSEIFDVLAGS